MISISTETDFIKSTIFHESIEKTNIYPLLKLENKAILWLLPVLSTKRVERNNILLGFLFTVIAIR